MQRNLGNVGKQNRSSALATHDDAAHLVQILKLSHGTQEVAARALLHPSAGCVHVVRLQSADNVGNLQPIAEEQRFIERDTDLTLQAAGQHDIRNTGKTLEARFQRLLRSAEERFLINLRRSRQRHRHDGRGIGVIAQHVQRFDVRGSLPLQVRRRLLHFEKGKLHARFPVEVCNDDGGIGAGDALHAGHATHGIEGSLHHFADAAFGLGGA